jgi:hypothetical protein
MSETNPPPDAERERIRLEQRQLILDYKSVFASPKGQVVLQDLCRTFGWLKPTALPGVGSEEVFRRESQKTILYHIHEKVNSSLAPAKKRRATSEDPS